MAVRRAYQLAPRQGEADEIESAYLEAFGDGLPQAFDEIAEEQPCGLREWQCDPEVVPTVSMPFGFTSEQTAACESEQELIGAELSGDEEWYPEAVFAFEFEEETSFVFESENASIYGFFCRSACAGHDGQPPDVVYPYDVGVTTLPAGRYFFGCAQPTASNRSPSGSTRPECGDDSHRRLRRRPPPPVA